MANTLQLKLRNNNANDKDFKMSKAKGKASEQDQHIQRLERKIRRLERDLKKAKSENKTLKDAWEKTEAYLLAISEDKELDEIREEIETKTNLTKFNKECPNCGNNKMRKTNYNNFYIEICENESCGYRNRIHEARSNKTKGN